MKLLETMDLKLESKDRSIRIVPVYRPPSSKKRKYPISNFYDDMENLVSYYKTMKDEVIFCGDYNVHVNKPNNAETCRFNSIIESAELQQHVTEKTHNKGNTLDLVGALNSINGWLNFSIPNSSVVNFLSFHVRMPYADYLCFC